LLSIMTGLSGGTAFKKYQKFSNKRGNKVKLCICVIK
jgi:hypothetical protein